MSERPVVPCVDCEAPVIGALDADTGEHIPVDAVPSPAGNLALEISANTVPIAHRGLMAHTFAHEGTGLHTAHQATCKTRPPRVPVHAFAVDERVPADWYGRRWCLCGVPGEPGDHRHPVDAPPLRPPTAPDVIAQAAQQRDAAILGERDHDADLIALARRVFQQADPPAPDLADRVSANLRGRDTAS